MINGLDGGEIGKLCRSPGGVRVLHRHGLRLPLRCSGRRGGGGFYSGDIEG